MSGTVDSETGVTSGEERFLWGRLRRPPGGSAARRSRPSLINDFAGEGLWHASCRRWTGVASPPGRPGGQQRMIPRERHTISIASGLLALPLVLPCLGPASAGADERVRVGEMLVDPVALAAWLERKSPDVRAAA